MAWYFWMLLLEGACDAYEDGSAWCWGFVWSVPW